MLLKYAYKLELSSSKLLEATASIKKYDKLYCSSNASSGKIKSDIHMEYEFGQYLIIKYLNIFVCMYGYMHFILL